MFRGWGRPPRSDVRGGGGTLPCALSHDTFDDIYFTLVDRQMPVKTLSFPQLRLRMGNIQRHMTYLNLRLKGRQTFEKVVLGEY